MAADGVAPQVESATASVHALQALLDRLDHLHEQHLALVDKYIKARSGVHKKLALGYLDIAQANFTSPNKSRYGRDYYDDRMQAFRRVQVRQDAARGTHNFSVVEDDDEVSSALTDLSVESLDARGHQQKENHEGPETGEVSDQTVKKEPAVSKKDALRWFGVLVPPALRSVQRNFTSVVTDSVPELATLDARLRHIEIEIRRTKKKITKTKESEIATVL